MLTKAELIEKGRHYFDKKDVNKMYATSDGNFFYESSRNYGDSHAKSKKIELIEITRADLKAEKKDDLKAPEKAQAPEQNPASKKAPEQIKKSSKKK